jgi:hypothetical protein
MAKNLPNWLPEGVVDLQPDFDISIPMMCSKYKELFFPHLDEDGQQWATAHLFLGEDQSEYGVLLRSYEIPALSDEEIVRAVRTSYAALHAKTCYEQIADFLERPAYYVNSRFSQAHFQANFEDHYRIGMAYADLGEEPWIYLMKLFKPYWDCENSEGGYVYCLHDQLGHYKIGISKQVTTRLKQLSTQPPFEIVLEFAFKAPFARRYEGLLHNIYSEKRLKGEWFTLTSEDIATIKRDAWFDRCEPIPGATIVHKPDLDK